MGKQRKFVFCTVICVLLYFFIEAASLGALYLLKKYKGVDYRRGTISLGVKEKTILMFLVNDRTTYLTFSAELGWNIKENVVSSLYSSNSKGIRGEAEYEAQAPDGIIRISAFGDSFTHGDDVKNNETWEERLAGLGPNLQVLNFGVPGYGVDQAYLRYLGEGRSYNSDIVFIGFMPENIFRHVNVFRLFYAPATMLPLSKPRYIIEDGKLVLRKNPIDKLAAYALLMNEPNRFFDLLSANDYFAPKRAWLSELDLLPSVRLIDVARLALESHGPGNDKRIISGGQFNVSSEAFKVTAMLFDEFYATVKRDGALPLIVLFPSRLDVQRASKGKPMVYAPLISYLAGKGYRYIDLMDAFKDMPSGSGGELFLSSEHYSPKTNNAVARYIDSYLVKEGLYGVGAKE